MIGEALPSDVVVEQGRLAAAAGAYERLKLERPTITATTVLGFGALSLVVMFAAMWIGLHLSRRFTEPLLALVATTQRVAGGDDLIEVPIPAEDEVGLLVSSFNAMVRRLRERDAQLSTTVRRLDAVLGAVRTGVLTLDAERRWVTANPAAAALLGMPGLVGAGAALDELAAAGFAKLVETIRGASEVTRGSMTIYPGGVGRAVEVAVVPLGGGERPEGWVVVLEDLTQLLRAQRLAAWSEAARRIAHQIKNPLTPIRLAAERIARHVERQTPDVATVVPQGCKAIVEHVQAMQEMVDAFARYAKLPPMARRPVVVSDLVRQVVGLYDGVRRDVAVRFEDGAAGVEVLLDPEQFRQVLTNLVDNAVKYASPGATITVSGSVVGDRVRVSVADTGPGIEPQHLPRLFERFYRVDTGRSRELGGTGLGLSIVKNLVEAMGGTVGVESTPGKGTTFWFSLPRA
jgi:two-component system nitrogen regulation sensor histidine kinase NtrY